MSHVSQSALWGVGELNAGAPKKATTIACHAVFTSLLSTIFMIDLLQYLPLLSRIEMCSLN